MKLKLKNISKSFKTPKEKLDILNNITYEFEQNKFYAIIGHSGSGKTTLIKSLGLISEFSSGEYFIDDKNVALLTEKEKTKLRGNKLAFIFQDYMLDEYLKAYENVMIPMFLNKKIIDKKKEAYSLLKSVGLEDRLEHFPKELSGGEQQRVSIARALVNNPDYILADEPTGNLDEKNEKIIFEKLKELSKSGKGVIVVSHSKDIENYADVILEIKDGNLKEIKKC